MDKLRKERAAAKRRFNRKVKFFNQYAVNDGTLEVLQDIYNEICEALGEVDLANEKILSNLGDIDENASEIQCHEAYIEELESIKHCLHDTLAQLIAKKITEKGELDKQKLLVKKIDPPHFDGNVREFPTFVKDYKRLVESYHGQDSYILRQSLTGKALSVVSGMDDYSAMWDRLEERFGSTSKVVDTILSDIRALKPVAEGQSRRLMDMITTIETCYLDLQKMSLTKEVENSTVLTLVEKLLPQNLKREWASKTQNLSEDSKFEEMVKFLTNERKVIEYMEDDSRHGTSQTKALVHVTQNSDETHELVEAIKQLTAGQEKCQKQINECCINLSQAMHSFSVGNKASESKVLGKYNSDYIPGGYRCLLHNTNNHDIKDCSAFRNLTNNEKFECLRRRGVCFVCLRTGHVGRDCNRKSECNIMNAEGNVCGKLHHPLLHTVFVTDTVPNVNISGTNHLIDKDGVLLMISNVRSGLQVIPTLWDSGSTLTLITHRMAMKLGLRGKEADVNVIKIGNVSEKLESKIYILPLIDVYEQEWKIEACGIDEITADIKPIDMKPVSDLFGIPPWQISRPSGKIELLIGIDYCSLMPTVVKTIGALQLMSNMFGWCIRGSLSSQPEKRNSINVCINHVVGLHPDELLVEPKATINKQLEGFFAMENLGTDCSPRCGSCKCGKCSLSGEFTIREERELRMIEEGLKYNANGRCWESSYPWISDPTKLPNNFPLALACLRSTEKRLTKLGVEYSRKYHEQIMDMETRGVARKLTPSEMSNYRGPIHYIPHHEVHKPNSISTPLRIVFNASSSYQGFSLNESYAKGPDVLNSIIGILMRFRQHQAAMVGDIRKMYNSVKISELDQHCHRFLWRDMEVSQDPDHYLLTTVTFGDRPAGIIAMLALRKTAEMNKIYPCAEKMIIQNSYVDDILISVENHEEVVTMISQVDDILLLGGFKMKQWVVSGDCNALPSDLNILETNQERVLGLIWKPHEDIFTYRVKLNFSRKMRGMNAQPDLESQEFSLCMPSQLTKRMVLSQISKLYDPLGFLTPFTLKTKLLMRDMLIDSKPDTGRLGWDDPINKEMYLKWKDLFGEMYEISSLEFKRCLKPRNAVGKPSLVVFSDGSSKAYGACAYVRWLTSDGSSSTHLLASKGRLAPTRQLSIPRLELCGAVLACRLRKTIETEMDYDFKDIKHLTDSAIVRAQIQKESFRFNTFVANRIAEIQSKSQPHEWYWLPTKSNPADLTTRGCKPLLLGDNSIWQRGPEFLALSEESWPIRQSFDEVLPDIAPVKGNINMCVTKTNKIPEDLINLGRFSSYIKLINVTARVLRVSKERSFKSIMKEPSALELENAEMYWMKQVQRFVSEDWRTRFKRLGPNINDDGIITVGHRVAKYLKDNWNKSEYILLVNHPFTRLYICYIHNLDHSGVESTLAKLQSKYWIPGARKLIRSVRVKCVICRKLDKRLATQCMGQLPKERLCPSPSFSNTAIDLFGPFLVKDIVKQRTKLKVYGVIFTCLVSRAVYLDLSENYDTESFLKVFRRFVAIRGFPRYIHSDRGTQLIAANKELREMMSHWDLSEILKFGRNEGMIWEFNKSADAPWENGSCEALIKSVKRSILISIGDNLLSYGELQTVMFEVANMLNERPIGIKPGSDISLGGYLCPNDLILGRASIRAPTGIWESNSSLQRRHTFMNKIIDSFWTRWTRDYFPTLLIRQKWHTEQRNMQVGDVVLMHDKNPLKGNWKMARVVTATPGKDGKVRDVTVKYKIIQPGQPYSDERDIVVNRPVHRLVVVLPIEEQLSSKE